MPRRPAALCPVFPPFSLLPGARLADIAALVGVPRRRLFWGVDTPGVVWCREGGLAVFVAGTRTGLDAARARFGCLQ